MAALLLTTRGPFQGDYVHSADVPVNAVNWSGCHAGGAERVRNFMIGTTITLKSLAAGERGLFTVDSLDGKTALLYDIIWRRCQPGQPKTIATCHIAGSPASGSSIFTKGVGRNSQEALEKARTNVADRCLKFGHSLARCDAASAICNVASF